MSGHLDWLFHESRTARVVMRHRLAFSLAFVAVVAGLAVMA